MTLLCVSSGFSPYTFTTNNNDRSCSTTKTRRTTRLCSSDWRDDGEESSKPLDKLLRVVENLSDNNNQVNGKVIGKMEELERALSMFLDDARGSKSSSEQQRKVSPRPPSIPPPLVALGIGEKDTLEGQSLQKAEQALFKLRQRLREEEANLRKAEEALMRSLQEEEVLKKAEFVLQQSRAAAEKRKAEAIKKTNDAVISAERTRNYQRKVQEKAEQDFKRQRRTRGTVPLSNIPNSNNSNFNNDDMYFGNAEQEGVPTLYDWVQDVNGSLTGKVRGSKMFVDGTTVSTSPVSTGATGGTIVTTSSGSQYYLEKKGQTTPTRPIRPNAPPTRPSVPEPTTSMARAPPGVPTISNWEVLEDGGISGLTENGDYIETSPVASGPVKNGSVVRTSSGSRYFLSPDYNTDYTNLDPIVPPQNVPSVPRSGTITIPKNVQGAMGKMDQAKPRSTFSLASLGVNRQPSSTRSNVQSSRNGIPTLTNWSINNDNTITGVISGSMNIPDGDLVTTSPIVRGERKRFGTVTTESGSIYFLG